MWKNVIESRGFKEGRSGYSKHNFVVVVFCVCVFCLFVVVVFFVVVVVFFCCFFFLLFFDFFFCFIWQAEFSVTMT